MKILIGLILSFGFSAQATEVINFVGGIGQMTCLKSSSNKVCQSVDKKTALSVQNVEMKLESCYESSFKDWLCGDTVIEVNVGTMANLAVKYSVIKYTDKSYCFSIHSALTDLASGQSRSLVDGSNFCFDQISDLKMAIKSLPVLFESAQHDISMSAYLGNSQNAIERLFRRSESNGNLVE